MSIRLQHLREAFSFLSTFTGRVGEIVVDTTNNRLQVHDGVTAGGWPAAKLAEVITNGRTAVSDANYTALATDRTIAYTALTASRSVTLPSASSYPTGTRFAVFDESGACSAANVITLNRAGSDTIDGAMSAVISVAYGYMALQSNGSAKWTVLDQAASNLTAVGIGTAADPSNPLSVYGTSALFNSAGNFNFTINKAAAANTASTIYEDGFSARAQVGLCGDDNFHFKVSPNGSTFYDALDIAGSSGVVTANFGLIGSSLTTDGNLNLAASGNTQITLYAASGGLYANSFLSGTYAGQVLAATPNGITFTQLSSVASSLLINSYSTGAGFTLANSGITQFSIYTAVGTGQLTFQSFNPSTGAYLGSAGTMNMSAFSIPGAYQVNGNTAIGSDRTHYLGAFTVSTLPAPGSAGRIAYASNGRMFNGSGTLESAGAGTGGLVIDNGSAWKIAGTNQTVQA
jgi:hypothetical protein